MMALSKPYLTIIKTCWLSDAGYPAFKMIVSLTKPATYYKLDKYQCCLRIYIVTKVECHDEFDSIPHRLRSIRKQAVVNIKELTNQNEIDSYLKKLSENNIRAISLDIECEFNLHCYGEHLCLIQIFDGRNKIIIDPFKFNNHNSFKTIFEKRDLLKIMYDSSSDSLLLEKQCGIKLKSILDLRPAVSLLEYQKQSLSNILSDELGIQTVNKKKFQMYNWMKRPIDKESIEYAMSDVLYLFDLKNILLKKLIDKNLLDEYLLRNLMIQPGNRKKSKLTKYEKAKGYNKLAKNQKKLFQEIFAIREEFARKLNKPPNFVFSNISLLKLCKNNIKDPGFIKTEINRQINEDVRSEILKIFIAAINQKI